MEASVLHFRRGKKSSVWLGNLDASKNNFSQSILDKIPKKSQKFR